MCFTFLSCNIVSVKGSNIYNTIVEIHETELIAGLKSGESRAYRTLFDNYYHLLFRIACQYVRDDTVADTIVGDVLSHIWETRESLHITSSLQAYLVCCIRNYAINYQKKLFADREISIDDYEEYPEAILQGLFLSDEYPLGQLLEKELNEQILLETINFPAKPGKFSSLAGSKSWLTTRSQIKSASRLTQSNTILNRPCLPSVPV